MVYGECWFTEIFYFKHGGSQNATLRYRHCFQTLHHASDYIALMTRMLNDDDDRRNKNVAMGHETVMQVTAPTITVPFW